MKLKIFILTFASSRPIIGTSKQMQGFFSEKFPDYDLFNQHDGDKYKFRYPLIQYKMINGPMVVGINEGTETLKQTYDQFKEIILGRNTYNILQRNIHIDEYELGISDKMHLYRLVTPIMALDTKNYKKFDSLRNYKEIETTLAKRINTYIVDHMSRDLGYNVPERLQTDFKLREITKSRFEGSYMITFYGDFRTNFIIPDYLSIGKARSIGFGTVVQLNERGEHPLE